MRRTVMMVGAVAVALTLVAVAPVGAATPRLPDLGMAPLADIQVETQSGRKLLRFSATVVNVGIGPFDIRGNRPRTSVAGMKVRQRLFNTDGTKTVFLTGASMFYSGDGHDHWHIRDLQRYTIHSLTTDSELGAGAKVGFCFWDNVAYRTTLPRAPQSPRYNSCGSSESLTVNMGLSVGWGDLYPWWLPDQWIDITGMPAGDYILRAHADPKGFFTEANVNNNKTWTKIRISATDQVTVLEQGPSA